MPEYVKHSTVFLYADDAKLLKPITCLLDCLLFQQDLDVVADWSSTWQLTLNISKCLYIRYGLANKPSLNYSLMGVILSQVSNVTDLGVIFDSKLDFSTHCHNIAAKGFAGVNMILKCFHSKDRVVQCKLYTTFVRPILEYNSTI